MTTPVLLPPADRGPIRRPRLADIRALPATAHVVLSMLIGIVTMTTVIIMVVLATTLAVTVVFGMAVLLAAFACSAEFTRAQRARFLAGLGVSIPAMRQPDPTTGWMERVAILARRPSSWRQLLYHFISGLVGLTTGTIVVTLWSAGLLLATVFAWGWTVPVTPGGWWRPDTPPSG